MRNDSAVDNALASYHEKYTRGGFKLLKCKGHSKANHATGEAEQYKEGKSPVSFGWTKPDYKGLSLSECEAWLHEGGWLGGVVPPGRLVLDYEDGYSIQKMNELHQSLGIQPGIHDTTNGKHSGYLFHKNVTGHTRMFTTLGFPVTPRHGGKSYLILAPSLDRAWGPWVEPDKWPAYPEELLPYDPKNKVHVMRCASFVIGELLDGNNLDAYEDVDCAFIALLVEAGMSNGYIYEAMEIVYKDNYDMGRTEKMLTRVKDKLNSEQAVIGGGSLVRKLRELKALGTGSTNLLKDITQAIGWLAFLSGKASSSESTAENIPNPEDWGELIPFDDYSKLPLFPSQVLPPVFRDMVMTVAECIQVDEGLPGTILLGVLASALQRKVYVSISTHVEPTNLYTCSVLPSGERKSPTFKVMTFPIYERQSKLKEDMAGEIRESENRFKVNEAKIAKYRKKAVDAEDPIEVDGHLKDSEKYMKEMEKYPILKPPRYIVDDITPEKLGLIMSDNGERLSIMSPEGNAFDMLAGLYSNKPNIDLCLKAYTGDPWSSDRMSRSSLDMKKPALTMSLTVQPDVIREIGGNPLFKGRGLLARFLYSIPPPKAGTRKRMNKVIPQRLLDEYSEEINRLFEIPSEEVVLMLSQDAQAVWDVLYNETEDSLGPNGQLSEIQDWGNKMPGSGARIAGLLHYAEHGAGARTKFISAETVASASALACYYREHALFAFGLMKQNSQIESAKKILEYLTDKKPDTFTGRDIMRNKNWFKKMDSIYAGVTLLLERGYVREIPRKPCKRGKPLIKYEVNPEIYLT